MPNPKSALRFPKTQLFQRAAAVEAAKYVAPQPGNANEIQEHPLDTSIELTASPGTNSQKPADNSEDGEEGEDLDLGGEGSGSGSGSNGIFRDGSKNFNIRTCVHMILGQLRKGARQAKNAPLSTGELLSSFSRLK